MENVFKATNSHGKGFEYLREKFRNVSDAKLKDGIFIGPQMREIIKDYYLNTCWRKLRNPYG